MHRLPPVALLALLASPAAAQERAPRSVHLTWRFEHVNEGYDHQNRLVITADGVVVGQSHALAQTTVGAIDLTVPWSARSLHVVDKARYQGVWEDHTQANDYSVDCVWDVSLPSSASITVELVCDIESGARQAVR